MRKMRQLLLFISFNTFNRKLRNGIVPIMNSSCEIISFLFITEEKIELTEMRKFHERKASILQLKKIVCDVFIMLW